jgi:hypothetical protein
MNDMKFLVAQIETLVQQAFDAGAQAERDRFVELLGIIPTKGNRRRRKKGRWTLEMDEHLKELRLAQIPIRQIAKEIFGDASYVGSISGRIKRLGLPVNEYARLRGQASQAAQKEKRYG